MEHRNEDDSLGRLLRYGAARIDDPATFWIDQLRLRRLMFAGVLLAPVRQGGLGLTRDQSCRLDPRALRELRPRIGRTPDGDSCPACAVWSWLHVLGTNNGWSRSAVRALAHQRDESGETHRHLLADPSPDWQDCANLLPAIDRWGYIDQYGSMHRSSLSVLIMTIAHMLDPQTAPSKPVDCTTMPRPGESVRRITPEEEAVILARADELNTRIAEILKAYDET